MTIARVQFTIADGVSDAASLTPGSSPTDGNLMILAVAATGETFTTPSGWTLADRNTATMSCAMFYKEASGESGSYTVPLSASSAWVVTFAEYSGTGPYKVGSNNNNGSGTETDTKAASTIGSEILVASVHAILAETTFVSVANGGTIVDQATSDRTMAACFVEEFETPDGSTNEQATASDSAAWSAAIATFHRVMGPVRRRRES